MLFFTYSASRAWSADLTEQVVAHGTKKKKKKRFGVKARKKECSSLKTALHKTYKKIFIVKD